MKRELYMACPIAFAMVIVAAAQTTQDAVIIGGQTYLRTQRIVVQEAQPPGVMLGEAAVAACGGHAAYSTSATVYTEVDWTDQAWVAEFDSWNEPVHDFVQVTPSGTSYYLVDRLVSGHSPGRTWIAWYNGSGDTLARVFDEDGQPVGPTFVAMDGYQPLDHRGLRLDVDDQRVVIEMNDPGPEGNTQIDQYVRFFTRDGLPLSEVIPVAVSSVSEEFGDVALTPDGGAALVYLISPLKNLLPGMG